MKRIIYLLTAIFVIGLIGCSKSGGSQKQTKSKAKQAYVYVNSEYGFKVKFDTVPKTRTSTTNIKNGKVVEHYFYNEMEQNGIKCTEVVDVIDYPEFFENQANPSYIVELQVKQIASNMGLTQVIDTSANDVTGYPSYYMFASDQNNNYGVFQGIAYKNRIYVIAGLTSGENSKDLAEMKCKNFVFSFKFLK